MASKHAPSSLTLEKLWQFSLDYYAVHEVKEACLCLQNHHHGNVNLLLLLKWLDENKLTINSADWSCLLTGLQESETLVHAFRDLRRRLKVYLPESLYREALQFELCLEKQQQAELISWVNQFTLTPNQGQALTERYCQQLGAEHLARVFALPLAQA